MIPPARKRRFGGWELGLLVLALTVRIGWATSADTGLWMDHVFNDATAISLAEGRGFTAAVEGEPFDPAIFRTPGYSAFAAGVYSVAGHSVRTVYVLQALLDAITCLLLWGIALRRLGPTVARFTFFLAATYPFFIYPVGTFSPETLLIFLGTLLLYFVDGWGESGDRLRVAAVAILAGVLVWVKPVFLPLPVFLLLTERVRRRPWRVSLLRAAVVGVVMAAMFAPWVIRNHRAFGRFVLAGEMGVVVWHGTWDFDQRRTEMIETGFANAKKMGEDRYENQRRWFTDSHALLEEDRKYLQKGIDRLRERPLEGLLLDPLRRVPRLWVSTSFVGGPKILGLMAAAACIGYLCLGAAGMFLSRGRLRELGALWLLPLLLTAAYAAFHVEARYTLPARPTLLLLGGVALAWIVRRTTRVGSGVQC